MHILNSLEQHGVRLLTKQLGLAVYGVKETSHCPQIKYIFLVGKNGMGEQNFGICMITVQDLIIFSLFIIVKDLKLAFLPLKIHY